jgi:quercetin dioxygenase-like cupin family protein
MTRNLAIALALSAGIAGTTAAQAADPIVRKELGVAEIGARTVGKVDAREIEFKPLQETGLHKHPCPVVGYIVSGTVSFEVEGQPTKILKAGEVFFEPANTPILHFDNPSKTEGLKFIAYYLLKGDEKSLIEMLPAK